MRGFDIWLGALKTRVLDGASKFTVALGDVFTSAPWLEASWFLIVPLALNAFVLVSDCHIKGVEGASRRREQGQPGIASWSLIVAIVLAAGTVVYLVLLARHHS